jgi:hypothetical protein
MAIACTATNEILVLENHSRDGLKLHPPSESDMLDVLSVTRYFRGIGTTSDVETLKKLSDLGTRTTYRPRSS